MTVAVPPDKLEEFLALARDLDVKRQIWASIRTTGSSPLCEGSRGSDDSAGFPARWPAQDEPRSNMEEARVSRADLECPADLTPTLLGLMGRWNICSKERLIRQYDHEVQGGTVVKPLVGITNDGPATRRGRSETALGQVLAWGGRLRNSSPVFRTSTRTG